MEAAMAFSIKAIVEKLALNSESSPTKEQRWRDVEAAQNHKPEQHQYHLNGTLHRHTIASMLQF